MAGWIDSLSGTMSPPLTVDRGEERSMSSAAASHAKTSAQPGREQESQESAADSGDTWRELSVKFDLATCSWRTHHSLFPEVLDWCSLTLPRWGMMRDGELLGRTTPVLHTGGNGAGLLPTPSGVNGGVNHVMGRLDEWGGSSNPFRGTELGKVRCASFEEWMMGWPIGWTGLTALETDRCLKQR